MTADLQFSKNGTHYEPIDEKLVARGIWPIIHICADENGERGKSGYRGTVFGEKSRRHTAHRKTLKAAKRLVNKLYREVVAEEGAQ